MTRKNTMEEHHYPIIVEGDWGPAKNTKNILQIHFQSKKKSQGGDCMVRYNDGSNFATILFKSSHIRDEVLSKAEHIITIDNQQIKLKVYKPSDPEEQADSTGTKMEQAYGYQEPRMTHEITGLKPIIEKFLERGTNQLEREKNSVTEDIEISPAMYSLLEQDGLKTVCPHLQIDYNKKINRLYLSGLHTEILIFKTWVLEKKINMKQKSLQINSSILEFLRSVDCDEMSRDLFISHGITAVYTIANEDVVVIGSTERALKEAEKRINTVLITKDLTVEDQGVLQMPEWLNLKKQLENMFSTHKKISVLINLSRKRDKVLVSGFRKPVMEVSENLGRFIEEHTKIVEKVHVQSLAVVDFIKDRKSQDWQHFIKSNEVKVSFDPKKPLIKLSGERAFVQPARIFFERLAGGLYTDTLIIKKAGAKKYFKDQGKIMLSILLKEIRFVVVLQEDDMREEEGDLFQVEGWNQSMIRIFDEIEPAIFQLCGETPKDLSEARDMIKSMILREHVTIPIRDPAIAHFTKEDGETLNAMQRELTVSVRLEKKGQDSVITLEGLTRDVHTADSRIRNMIRKVERTESRATIQRNKVDMKAGAQSPLPSHWKDMTGQPVILVNLTAGSKEYADVEKEFRRTNLTFNIIKIERVQNSTLWKSYMIKKEELEVKNKHKNNEKLLFHGTDADKTDQINHHGFNRSFAGMHGAVYGNGTYFAVDPSYSARGYSKPDVNGHKRMYLARVLVGDFTQGKPGLPVPPAKSSSSVDLYNSVTDNMTNPSMFVIFNDVQAYPEYLITFQQGRAGAYIDHRKFLSHSAHNFIW